MRAAADASNMIQLSSIDNFEERRHIVRYVLHFPIFVPRERHGEVYATLQTGLSKTRALIPFVGGLIVPHGDDKNDIGLKISPDRNVKLVYKDLASMDTERRPLSNFANSTMDITRYDAENISPRDLIPDGHLPTPVFAAQINFTDDGVLVVAGVHHSACDGSGFAGIMKLWASQMVNEEQPPAPVILTRMFDRAAIIACRSVSAPDISDYPGLETVNPSLEVDSPLPQTETCILKFSCESLRALKKAASSDNAVETWVSTHDALSALLWSCITRARRIPIRYGTRNESTVSMLSIAVDGRTRLTPCLSADYLGNASLNCPVRSTVESLLPVRDSLPSTANAIRSALGKFGAESFADSMALMESLPVGQLKRSFRTANGPDFAITSWARMGLYEQYWGRTLGRAACVRAIVYH